MRRVILPILAGSGSKDYSFRDLEYVRDLGLVALKARCTWLCEQQNTGGRTRYRVPALATDASHSATPEGAGEDYRQSTGPKAVDPNKP